MNICVTGGAGFIGSNIADYYLRQGHHVVVLDNLSRPGGGAERNIGHLLGKYGDSRYFQFIHGDIRDLGKVITAIKKADVIFHTAAQTAMTTSLDEPVDDFEVNALGTLNVLEAARIIGNTPVTFYLSTNKVYGDLTKEPVILVEKERRWEFEEKYQNGIDESYPLDFEGPYGCSKGAGDAYCLDYAHTFNSRVIVFRMSGIYGISQYPTEDQGWIAWFVRQAMTKAPINIYGDGKQVRDILYISDLLKAFDAALEKAETTCGQVYNIGGSRANSISILELLEFMNIELGIKPSEVSYQPWRRADQKIYISNTDKALQHFGWKPQVSKDDGIKKLYNWMKGG